jgi:hypothetical protein
MRTYLCGTADGDGLTAHSRIMDECRALVEKQVRGKTQIPHSKPFSNDTLTAINPIRTAPGPKQDFRSEK